MKRISLLLTSIAMLFMSFNAAADNYLRGDCNQDGSVDIGDVTSLIDFLLTNEWPKDLYDMDIQLVVTESDGTEQSYQLDKFEENACYHLLYVNNELIDDVCQFHFVIDGVEYGAENDMTLFLFDNPFENYNNPLIPGANNYILPNGLYHVGILKNNHNYYVFVRQLYIK